MDAALLWDELNEAHPLAARLALLSCLPVRVAPALLRLARLRLLPQGGTGDEADLWLSDLVEARSAGGFSYRREARDDLRARLCGEPGLLDEVWLRIHCEHAPWLAPRARLEEELTWRLLRDRSDPAIELLWAGVVEELDTGPNAEGVARWVVRAVPDLPQGTLDHRSGVRAYFGANLLLGDASALGSDTQRFLETSEFAFATRRLPRRRIFVGLGEDSLILSQLREIENGHPIDIPATRPLWLQLEHGSPSLPDEVVTLVDTELQHALSTPEVTLRSLDGAAHLLALQRGVKPQAARQARPPRVHIVYDVEIYGAVKQVQLPFVTGVLADLGGHPAEPLPPLADRKFVQIDVDNFDARMKAMRPRLAIQVPNTVTGEGNLRLALFFESMNDFSPGAIASQVPPISVMLATRRRLADLVTFMDKSDAEALVGRVLANPRLVTSVTGSADDAAAALNGVVLDGRRLSHLVDAAFQPKSAETKAAIAEGIVALARLALDDPQSVGADPGVAIQSMIGALDRQLSAQVSEIYHHPDFRNLEGAWRGLQYLVNNTETDEILKIRVINVAKDELAQSLREFAGEASDQSPLFRKVCDEEFSQFGGEPFGCLVVDFAFDHSPPDVALLGELAKVAAAAHAPLIGAASPTLMQMESWQELANPRDLSKIFSTPEYSAWRALRESDDARYLGLAMPRILARLPYGVNTTPVEDFDFEEAIDTGSSNGYTWMSAAYAMAVNIHRSFKQFGWCANIRGIESGGAVAGLPVHAFPTDDGGVDLRSPVEIGIADRREAELARNGLMPLLHRKGSDFAAFISAASLQKPAEYDDADATANSNLAARWPYLFASCRFMHYVKCIARDRIDSFRSPDDLQRWLNNWILHYVDGNPAESSESMKAQRPLANAEVTVEEVANEPDILLAKLFVRPHYQLEGLTVSLRLVTQLPTSRGN